MKVLVSSLEDKSYDVRAEVYQLGYEADEERFFMPRPIGDDWSQRITHKPTQAPEVVRIEGEIAFVVFHHASSAREFSTWLRAAEAEAQEGYRTMRG